ncbi:MAG: HupE/UreJ family protein [Rhodospirillales bacterium]|nr:HupE/UreJ family protein [Rhodospirillales bacterium]
MSASTAHGGLDGQSDGRPGCRRSALTLRLVAAWPAVAASAALVLCVAPARAHVESGAGAGLLAGLTHPVSGLDHVLAMALVGLWGAQLGRPAIWMLPVAFPLTMAFGGFLGLVGVHVPGVEIGIALSALLLGIAVAAELRPPLAAAAALVGAFAIFHGHAHGTELPDGQSGLAFSLGFVVATGCLHGAGILVGSIHVWRRGRIALRLVGATVAAAGAFFLARAIT